MTVRCPRCNAPVITADMADGMATCGVCALTFPYAKEDA